MISKLCVGAASLSILLAACSGGDSGTTTVAGAGTTGESSEPDSAPPSTDADVEPDTEAPASSESASTESQPETESDQPRGENQLPDVTMIDIVTGEEVSLSSFAPADTPIVLWFWAPH
jgi:hypothetical protein